MRFWLGDSDQIAMRHNLTVKSAEILHVHRNNQTAAVIDK